MRSKETSVAGPPVQSGIISVPVQSSNPTDYIDAFLKSQDVAKSSLLTYRRGLKQFSLWVADANVQLPTREDVLLYKHYLEDRGLSPATISSYLVCVRKLFAWMQTMKLCPNVAEGIKGAKRPRGFKKDPLTVDQAKELLDSIPQNDLIGKRDYALINLLIRTGLRTIEILRSNVGDIRQNASDTLLYVQGKGRTDKDDFVILTPGALKPINIYLAERGKLKEDEPLFTSTSNRNLDGRMTTQAISAIVRYRLSQVGLHSNRVTAHSLRHTAITLALMGGATIQEAQMLARHSDINTTLIYAHNIDRIEAAPEKKIDSLLT